MSRVDFAFGAPDRLRMACEVVRKHYEAGRQVVVYLSDARQLARFDRLLWGFESTAFVPHVGVEDPLAATTPVLLTSAAPVPAGEQSWLLNLDAQCPPGFEQFPRILEIVSEREADRTQARERWRVYQAQGCQVHAHKLGA
ncbi:DNA polymerase III subunit chi [Alcaligenes nematophilus]|jgi:DNA polymerase-3 subunit chi|uniref:DNA polymerase III subunit chi n=2 Tax=Alcaligenes TaxID=507 RepID=A0ABU3MPX0_9BURK|nr:MULTISPECIES: DNA polymerase III subunit chi [Alcaligenes]ASC89390.1 DNA polymerase III subunit chi [Alcaligenes faecalis]EKU30671.1 DNA polymerase III subunit chi [Alcaligenes sp. HPC1271]ERI33481.1 DNA polymerase III subunit chi [Alcaligenes sp. EGD-AK7]KGP00672.1 DNA polymerase III subunit chi [Alcaligenes faecalis]KVX06356.1 DNA polymerase III subunit chi [Alcaligenes faecalis]